MSDIALGLTRKEDESWLDAALRLAKPYGLESEVRDKYKEEIERGEAPSRAAWIAAYDWDLLELKK